MEHKIYQKNKDSEKIRNENEMRRLRRKLTVERFKSKTVKQFKDLMKDDGNMMEYIYPAKVLANNSTLLHAEQQTNGRRVEGSPKNGTASDDNENGVDSNARPEETNDGNAAATNDLQTKQKKYAETRNDEKTAAREKRDDVGKDGFADAVRGTSVSEIVTDAQPTPAAEETSTTTLTTTTTTLTTESRLTVLEAFGAARALEKWSNRFRLLNALDGMENDEDASATRVTESRAFVSETFGRTCGELRSSGTYDTLRRANGSMRKTSVDGRELRREPSDDSRNKKHERPPANEEDKWRVERQLLANRFEEIMTLIQIEGEYVRTWEDRWLVENRELLDEEEESYRNQIQLIEKESTIEDNYLKEAKTMFLEHTAKIDGMVEMWEKINSKNVSAIDVEILTLEDEQEDLNDSYEKLQVYIDELNVKINENEERNNEMYIGVDQDKSNPEEYEEEEEEKEEKEKEEEEEEEEEEEDV